MDFVRLVLLVVLVSVQRLFFCRWDPYGGHWGGVCVRLGAAGNEGSSWDFEKCQGEDGVEGCGKRWWGHRATTWDWASQRQLQKIILQ